MLFFNWWSPSPFSLLLCLCVHFSARCVALSVSPTPSFSLSLNVVTQHLKISQQYRLLEKDKERGRCRYFKRYTLMYVSFLSSAEQEDVNTPPTTTTHKHLAHLRKSVESCEYSTCPVLVTGLLILPADRFKTQSVTVSSVWSWATLKHSL